MREILFKAKRKDWRNLPKGEWWVEGYYVKYQPCASISEYVYGIVPAYASALYIIEIDPTTLCQYTGLKDKNEKKIWENDIVKTSKFGQDDGNGHNHAGFDMFSVKWDNGGFTLLNQWRRFNLRQDKEEYKVIGNIFDNPELLEVE